MNITLDSLIPRLIVDEDPEVSMLLSEEEARQTFGLELIASENYPSEAVRIAMASCFHNKYAEGYPGHRYYGGCEFVDEVENIAINRAYELFHADHANVQPHSGSQANMAAYAALLKEGDKILSGSMNGGAHLTHSSPVSFVSKLYNVVTYDVNNEGYYDYDAIRDIAKKEKPKLIVAGASAYPRIIDFAKFREIADEIGAYLMVDMAHIAGLVAGGVHPSPVPYADVVTTTMHKTLRGPRSGMILCKKDFAKAVDKAVFPRTQGGPLEHVIAAKAICLFEAMCPSFKNYAEQIVKNAQALAQTLMNNGFELVTNGTDNHLMLVDLTNIGISGQKAERMLDNVCITVNKNMIPNDTRKPSETSGFRIGTAAVTTRGLVEDDMVEIGNLISKTLKKEESVSDITDAVFRLVINRPIAAQL